MISEGIQSENADRDKKPRARRSGQITERGERKQMIRIFLGRDTSGKRRYHNKTFHGTKKQAEKWLHDALVRLDRDGCDSACPPRLYMVMSESGLSARTVRYVHAVFRVLLNRQ
jgi:hypothetical protein